MAVDRDCFERGISSIIRGFSGKWIDIATFPKDIYLL
jgi:hypothetical protein